MDPIDAFHKAAAIVTPSVNRAYYVDRIRVVLTALVVFHHTAITYGAPGGWYYNELPLSLSVTGLLLILFVSVNQAYFMGFFFLLAGYFTPNSYNRKSLGQFILDRLLRLGIPLLIFVFVLDPLTKSLVAVLGTRSLPFWPDYTTRLAHPGWNTGPLWFAEALLIFSFGYIIYRINHKAEPRQMEAPMPRWTTWFLSAIAVGIVALLLRQWVAVGDSVIGLQIGYFASYTFLFALGTIAWQRNWLDRLTWKDARPWLILSIVLLPMMVVTGVVAGKLTGHLPNVNSGFSIPAILYAFWEPFIAWGIIAAMLVWFHQHANKPSALWEFLAARAYAVYIIHAPVLVAISLLLRGWHGPALSKVAVTGSLACCASLVVASLLLMLPGARRVL
jgi:peptidoglycan/LPS O-acetylase OafA/YrhL